MQTKLTLCETDLAIDEHDKTIVIRNLVELRDDVWDTMSKNTRKAYQQDFNQYLRFCRQRGIPALASDWHITKDSCKAYVEQMIASPLGHHSIKRKLASIRFFIGICELPDPWKHSKLFTQYIAGCLKHKPAAQKQAKPLKLKDVQTLNRTLDLTTLLGLRDAALFNVALDTLFRAANIIEIKIKDIDWYAKTIFVTRSKTDQSGVGSYGYISNETAVLMKRWIDKARIEDGYLFRKLSPKQTVQAEPLQYQALLKRYATIGYSLNTDGVFTCHSTRTGGVLTMMEAGVPMADIVLSGHWKSEAMPIRYGQQFTASKTGMAKVR
ncbi:MAG: site-specific recombinase XerD [Paraglaciecola sp.]|jgi:site-specific recombinase XerD